MTKEKFAEEDLDFLSEEEKASLEEEEEKVEPKTPEEEEENPEELAEKVKEEELLKEVPKEQPEEEEEVEDPEPEPEPEVAQPKEVQHTIVMPKMDEIPETDITEAKEKMDEAKQQYDDGKISFDEYDALREDYKDLVRENKVIKRMNERAAEQNVESVRTTWQQDFTNFYADHKYFIQNPEVGKLFTAQVNAIVDAGQDAGLTNNQVLQKALEHTVDAAKGLADLFGIDTDPDKLREKLGLKRKNTKQAETDKKTRKARVKASEKAAGDVPPNLRKVPAAEENDTDEFGHLDNLSGDALEAAIERMDARTRLRYENRQ